jgi:hypothetical protein
VNLALAGRSIRVESASSRALMAIAPALAHLAGAPSGDGDAIRWTMGEDNDAWRPEGFGPAGAYRIRGGGFVVVQDDPASLEAFVPDAGITFRTTRAGFGAGDFLAHPASFALAAALSGPDRQVLHAGAVAHDGAAALLVGVGGVGKTTTALACALGGAAFLGDDLVLVETRGTPTAHSLFATAKLNPDSAAALGLRDWTPIGITPKSKAVVAVSERVAVAKAAPIAALIVLAPPVTGAPRAERIAPAAAMSLVMPTAIPVACRTGAPADLLRVVADLARRVPAWRLPVSWDLEALRSVVRAIVLDAAVAGAERSP